MQYNFPFLSSSSSSSNSSTTSRSSSSSTSKSSTTSPTSTMLLSPEEINHIDRNHVWHPYTSMPSTTDDNYLPIVTSANGCELTLASPDSSSCDNKVVIDGMSSWWACIHGYNHPKLNDAAINQIQNHMSHVMFGGLTHEPAAALAKELISVLPQPPTINDSKNKRLDKVFFCDSGSVAIEVAMKMALQYWYNILDNNGQQQTTKDKFLTIKGGYHGDTFHAMSVCDPINGMHHLFQSMLPKQIFCDRPKSTFYCTRSTTTRTGNENNNNTHDDDDDESSVLQEDISKLKYLLEQHHKEVAAIILEPIVQGAGGMYFYSPKYLKAVKQLCDEYDTLLICDEIATGFGRTGKLFAIEHTATATATAAATGSSKNHDDENDDNNGIVIPDILCLGKAISGGMMSFAATITSSKIASAFSNNNTESTKNNSNSNKAPVFMHGPTFMGNPLACSISLASLRLLKSYDWKNCVNQIENQLRDELEVCRDSPYVNDVRVLGAIGVIEMKQPMEMKSTTRHLLNQGVWLRPFGKLLYTMPPFIINKHQLSKITKAMVSIATTKHL